MTRFEAIENRFIKGGKGCDCHNDTQWLLKQLDYAWELLDDVVLRGRNKVISDKLWTKVAIFTNKLDDKED